MIKIRPGHERGRTQIDWLESYHTFSFSDYYDPAHMSFRHLRVINEDFVAPARGFGTHAHQDMEIITYLLEGALEHKDSMGNGSIIKPGEVQRMSAGTGVTHSEFNPSQTERAHLLQIWILPDQRGLAPSYEQKVFQPAVFRNQWHLIGSKNPQKDAVKIHQDVHLYAARLDPGKILDFELKSVRFAWVQVAKGTIQMNDRYSLKAGDGAGISKENKMTVKALQNEAELLLFDLV
jgi:hypothetical protein